MERTTKSAEKRGIWAERLAEQEASGLSMAAWCRRKDVGYATFLYWKKRLRGDSPAAKPHSR